ncbi:MAG: dihydroorotase [Saprospiraceae bacterium]|nr:dihydroorotase [Saprospiraceae bacterium]
MKCLIKKVKVIDPPSKYHGRVVDILVVNSRIEDIRASITAPSNVRIITGTDLHCSISWFDIGTQIGEPGLEHRENIESVAMAARAGGYGSLAPFPNTRPVIQTKADVDFIKNKASRNHLDIYPVAALSENAEGKEITEMFDLHHAGAVAFGDGLKPVQHAGVITRALEYVKPFDGLIIHHPSEKSLSQDAQLHEGEMSTMLGMKGNPYIAESIMLKRDLDLLAYSQSKLCIYGVSSAESVRIIKEGKKTHSDRLSCIVPYLNLIFTDKDLVDFDTNLKLTPPLRRKTDLQELVRGLKDGTIDAIASNHYPIEEEGKKLEFPYAGYGASGIETCFAACNTYVSQLDLETLVYKLSYGPREILKLHSGGIQAGEPARLTIFDPSATWKFESSLSKSKNNPFLGRELRGRILEVIN